MNQYSHRAAFSALALGLDALALTMLRGWPVALGKGVAGPASRVSGAGTLRLHGAVIEFTPVLKTPRP